MGISAYLCLVLLLRPRRSLETSRALANVRALSRVHLRTDLDLSFVPSAESVFGFNSAAATLPLGVVDVAKRVELVVAQVLVVVLDVRALGHK